MANFPEEKGKKISRRIPGGASKVTKAHIISVGRVMFSANWLQGGFYQIFEALLRDVHPERARAIWHSHKSDAGQRDMLAALAHETLVADHPVLMGMLWAIKQAGSLAGLRNDFAHTPMSFSNEAAGERLAPHAAEAPERRIERVNKIAMTRAAPHVRDDFYALGNYARALAEWMKRPDQYGQPPLPRRPPLRAIVLLGDDVQKNHHPSPSKRSRPHRSSPPKG